VLEEVHGAAVDARGRAPDPAPTAEHVAWYNAVESVVKREVPG
jgi:hypothetical protein